MIGTAHIGTKLAILTVSDSSATQDLAGEVVADLASAGGHRVVARAVVRGIESSIRRQLVKWISDPNVEVVIACGDARDVMSGALKPLITTHREPLSDRSCGTVDVAQCASTRVFVMPAALDGIVMTMEGLVLPLLGDGCEAAHVEIRAPRISSEVPSHAAMSQPRIAVAVPAMPVRDPRITTGSISAIGDLPADPQFVDLRRGAKRRSSFALAVVCVAGLMAVWTVKATTRRGAAAGADPSDDVTTTAELVPIVQPLPAATLAVPNTQTDRTPAPAAATIPRPSRTVTASPPVGAREHRRAATPLSTPADRPVAEDDAAPRYEDRCDEAFCKLNNNERECCTPFRDAAIAALTLTPQTLDRSMIAAAIASVKPQVLQCGETSATHGTVRVAARVGSDGRVISLVPDTSDAVLAECVTSTMHAATFPKTRNGGSFGYSFLF